VRPAAWTVIVTAPATPSSTAFDKPFELLAGLAGVTTALSLAGSVIFARRIEAPVERLETTALRLGRGEPVAPLRSGVRELDAVGDALAAAAAQHRSAEAALRDGEARFRALFEAAPIAVATVDPDSLRFVAFNERAYAPLGFAAEDFSGLRLADIAADLPEAALRARLKAGHPHGGGDSFETRFRAADGALRTMLVRAARVTVADRSLAYLAWADITERHEEQRALQQMTERQAAILDALPAHIALLDPDGRIVAVNQAWRRFGEAFGAAPAECGVGADYLAACAPAVVAGEPSAASALAGLQGVLSGGRTRAELAYPCRTMDGERWFQFIVVPDSEPDGNPAARRGAVVMHLDITARVHAEQALADSEARLRLFIDRAPAGIAVFDTEMRYLAVSRRFLKDYRLVVADPGSILGRSHYELFPEIPHAWRDVHRRVLAGESLAADDEAFPRADGRTDWLRWEMTPWRRQDGSVGGAILFSEIITARRDAEDALRASDVRLRLAVETVGLGTWDTDLETGQSTWSEHLFRILGLPPTEAPVDVGLWIDRVHPEDRNRVVAARQMALAAGMQYESEYRYIRPDGAERWLRSAGRILRDAAGNPIRFIGACAT
jgi:PAS domain S-box-containing protein